MLRRRLLRSLRTYKYVPGARLTHGNGPGYNNNLTTEDSADGSIQFTVRLGFRVYQSNVILAENWSRTDASKSGWAIGINSNKQLYYTEYYNGTGTTFTDTVHNIEFDNWYDLKFWAKTVSSSANGELYFSIDGGKTNSTVTPTSRYKSESSRSRQLVFGDSSGKVDLRGTVGCTGVTYSSSASVIMSTYWDIEDAPTSGDLIFSDTTGSKWLDTNVIASYEYEPIY